MTDGGRRIFDGDHLRATMFDGAGAGLIVTFDFRAIGKAGFAPPNRSAGFERHGFSQLSIRTRANDWFINRETDALEAVLTRIGQDRPGARLLGYSMGGYGALRFARALQAGSAVLVSPQVSIDPKVVPWDRRYRAEAAGFDPAIGDLAPRALPDLAGVILFDPFVRPDLRHARRIGRLFPGLALARLSFGGHPAVKVLRAGGKAWLVQRALRDTPPAAAPLIAAHRAARRDCPGYWSRLADRAEARHPALATAARARATDCARAAIAQAQRPDG